MTLAAAAVAPDVILKDIGHLRERLAAKWPGRPVKIAVTEYGAVFDGATSSTINSVAGALLTTDLLGKLAVHPDVLMAHHWSLLGNGEFGAISNQGALRPMAHVMSALAPFFQGERRSATVSTTATVTTSAAAGFIQSGLSAPALTTMVSRQGNVFSVLLINKSAAPAAVRIQSNTAATLSAVRCRALAATDPLRSLVTGWSTCSIDSPVIAVAPYSLQFVDMDLLLPAASSTNSVTSASSSAPSSTPILSVTKPVSGAKINSSKLNIAYSISAATTVARVALQVDNGSILRTSNKTSATINNVARGSHTLRVWMENGVGQTVGNQVSIPFRTCNLYGC